MVGRGGERMEERQKETLRDISRNRKAEGVKITRVKLNREMPTMSKCRDQRNQKWHLGFTA